MWHSLLHVTMVDLRVERWWKVSSQHGIPVECSKERSTIHMSQFPKRECSIDVQIACTNVLLSTCYSYDSRALQQLIIPEMLGRVHGSIKSAPYEPLIIFEASAPQGS